VMKALPRLLPIAFSRRSFSADPPANIHDHILRAMSCSSAPTASA
jgi:hypothetical protein